MFKCRCRSIFPESCNEIHIEILLNLFIVDRRKIIRFDNLRHVYRHPNIKILQNRLIVYLKQILYAFLINVVL